MRVLACGVRTYERAALERHFQDRHPLHCVTWVPDGDTVGLAAGYEAVCTSPAARLDAALLGRLAAGGTRLITQRASGYTNIDLDAARELGLWVARVSSYSPHSVAEFAWTLVHALNRHVHRSYQRTREFDFRLDGLLGRDLHGRAVGVVGTGRIGTVFARIAQGYRMRLYGWDREENPECRALGMTYLPLEDLLGRAEIVSLHVPLTPETRHLIDASRLACLPDGAILVNTGRGGLIDTTALVSSLRAGRLGGVGLDVYEEEERYFFRDLSDEVVTDDVLARLMTFPNVVVTSHQAFFTAEATATILATQAANVDDYLAGRATENTLVRGRDA
ncbi:2-hydroxyacid dehydrogenase [Actinomadura parmotrematis]|uniref:2-hydroxyacid dehydrogenase n=1 Tax=Actinomadura parmotrematis TaxID=2864039 RepID=A0ABS7FUF0_9ACTN|nr:2-hydroxyacid dehydrogenase [Actinomadura parmotrematis]MBW8483354.1 2-hydroxyacid dehydrogenase [Actinomadura parmotrematis]